MHSNDESVETKLRRIAKKASSDKDCQFTSLFHLMNEELLLGCFEGLRNNAASGIDGMTKLRSICSDFVKCSSEEPCA